MQMREINREKGYWKMKHNIANYINKIISYINGKLTVEFSSTLNFSTNAICWANVSLRKVYYAVELM